MRSFVIVILALYGLMALVFVALDRIEALAPAWADVAAFPLLIAGLVAWVIIIAVMQKHTPSQRPKPEGYVGRFRRRDGTIVHVGRLGDGKLMVASESAPGVSPKDLGNVTGRELATWTKLATTPDG